MLLALFHISPLFQPKFALDQQMLTNPGGSPLFGLIFARV